MSIPPAMGLFDAMKTLKVNLKLLVNHNDELKDTKLCRAELNRMTWVSVWVPHYTSDPFNINNSVEGYFHRSLSKMFTIFLNRDTSTSTQARGTLCAPSAPNASGRPVSSSATRGSTPERNPTSASFAIHALPSATHYADTPNANTLTTK